ncbi:MAG: alpha/beta hydrolase, partial [Comamonadaceae bacterium]
MSRLYRDFETQEQIDAQYDTAIPVADRAAEMRHYAERSAHARAALRGELRVPYGPTRAETLDIFPADAPGAPVFVFIHGGYWRALSAQDFSCVALGLQRRGITVVVPDYALCPAVTLDEIVRQVRAACAWVLRNIGAHGGDPRRVAVGGSSAGGHLAAMCLQTEWARDYGLP